MNKRDCAGNWSPHIFCQRCKAPLDIRKAVSLELDSRTNKYTNQPVPEEFSQGAFYFGAACAQRQLREDQL